MSYCKYFTIILLPIVFFASNRVYSQTLPECGISVKPVVIDASRGSHDGQVSLEFGANTSLKDLKIFIADPHAKEVWKQAEDGTVKGLKAGFYDILIVDTSRKECAKQITVEIKSK